jgi:hypothetical protein
MRVKAGGGKEGAAHAPDDCGEHAGHPRTTRAWSVASRNREKVKPPRRHFVLERDADFKDSEPIGTFL